MKLVSWNVNGLRACIQKGFLDVFQNLNADFFCLQETKLSEGQLQLELPGYSQFWCYAEKKGYSGTAIFTRHTPLSVQYGIGVPELDNEGRVITLEYKEFYLVTCYTPNAQRELARLNHRMNWDEAFRAYLQRLDAVKPVILCGDLNVAHKEIDLKNPASNRGNAGFSDQERESFQKTLDLGFTDTFRHLHPDKTGAYTWWSYMFKAREKNAGWRIDYFLVSNRIANAVYRADIHSHIFGSDHCPVSVDLDLLVNGSLFTPEISGTPKVVEAEEKSKKQTKSSPISGKDFASIIPIVALLLVFVVGASLLFQKSPSATPESSVSIPPAGEISFDVQVYYKPLTEWTDWYLYETIDADMIVRTRASVFALQDDGNTYFTSSIDGTATSNVFLRISGTEQNLIADPQYWNLTFTPISMTLNSTGLAEQVDFESLTIQPYYTDSQMTHFAGWLVWGRVPNQGWAELEFGLSIASTTKIPPAIFTTKVALYPYLTIEEASEMTSDVLLRHIVHHPIISNWRDEESNSLFLSNPETFPTIYNRLLNQYPALESFQYRPDSVDVLMNTDPLVQTDLCELLLHLDAYRDLMTPNQEYLYLTKQYPNADPLELSNPDIVLYRSTSELVAQAQDCLFLLAQCTSQESAEQVYNYIVNKSVYLSTLEYRSDAVSVVMEHSFFNLHMGHTDYQCFHSLQPACQYLLSQSVYRNKMTPLEEAKFISGRYSHGTPEDLSWVEPESSLSTYFTQTLLGCIKDNTFFINYLRQASSLETAYQLYLLDLENNRYLKEFSSRDNAFTTLELFTTSGLITDREYYAYMYKMWSYMLQRTEAETMTNQQLMDNIPESDYFDPITSALISIERLAPNHPYLSALLSRTDVVDFLMNCKAPEGKLGTTLPYRILQALEDQMTPAQQARMITGNFPNSNLSFDFSLNSETDPATMTTLEIVEYLDTHGSVIYTKYLTYNTSYDVKAEVYKILREHSNLLLELETRPDATEVLGQVYQTTTNILTPLAELRYIYQYYLPFPDIAAPDIDILIDESA